ncbi:MAG: class I SAM-dependent methyltransferase [Gemmataceae bacterium]
MKLFHMPGPPDAPAPLVLDIIADDDAMFDRTGAFSAATAREHYFRCGRSALRAVQLALAAAEWPPWSPRILDFSCGHGRVLRHLAAAYPQAEFHACDVNRPGVDFCTQHFGAIPIPSHDDPTQIELRRPYDLIWVGSLLTHFDALRWRQFLTLFHGALHVGGVAVVTTHGRWAAEILRQQTTGYGVADPGGLHHDYHATGFGYRPYNPADPGYGVSLSAIPWIVEQLHQLPGARTLLTLEKGWADHQDVIAWQRTAG